MKNKRKEIDMSLINIKVNEDELKRLFIEKLEERFRTLDKDLVFWDTSELKRRTCLSWNTIQDKFFYDPRFLKYKVGGKWLYPAEQTKEFLLQWISEQPRE